MFFFLFCFMFNLLCTDYFITYLLLIMYLLFKVNFHIIRGEFCVCIIWWFSFIRFGCFDYSCLRFEWADYFKHTDVSECVCVNFYLFCSVLLSWLCDDKKRWMSLWFSHTVELIQKLAIGRLERPLNFRKNFWALDIFVLVKWSFYFVCCVSVFFMGMFVPSFFWFVFWFCFARNWLNTLLNWNSVG